WVIVTVDDVVRDAGVVGMLRFEFLKDSSRHKGLGIALVCGIGRFVERERVENRRLGVIRVARGQARHCRFITCGSSLLRNRLVVLEECSKRLNPVALAICLLRSRTRLLDGLPTGFQHVAGEWSDQRIGSLADGDTPVRHGACWLLLCKGTKRLDGL